MFIFKKIGNFLKFYGQLHTIGNFGSFEWTQQIIRCACINQIFWKESKITFPRILHVKYDELRKIDRDLLVHFEKCCSRKVESFKSDVTRMCTSGSYPKITLSIAIARGVSHRLCTVSFHWWVLAWNWDAVA